MVKPSEVSNISMLSLISSSSSMTRTTPLRLDIHWFPYQRQLQPEGRSDTGLALHRDVASMLLDNSITDGQSQPRALAGSLRRKEGIVDLLDVFAADTGA